MAGLKLKGSGSLDNLSVVGKLVVGLVFFAMVGAAYFVVFFNDVESDIATGRQTLGAKEIELQQAYSSLGAFNKDLAEKARREQLVVKQKKILPETAETPAFLQAVQSVATISGVKLISWEPGDEQAADFYAKIPMSIRLQGRFHQVAKFFHGISQVDRIINLENVVMTVSSSSDARNEDGSTFDDRQVLVDVECLATAFRALKAGESSGKKKKKKGGTR